MARRKVKREWVRTFEVGEAEKHDKGHVVYPVTSWLYPEGFPEASTKLVTRKRFSEFQTLYKALSKIHKDLYLAGEMPSLPKANFFRRFDPQVLIERRAKCLELLEFAAKHPPLYNSQVFLNFTTTTVSSPTPTFTDEYFEDEATRPSLSGNNLSNLVNQGEVMEAAMVAATLAEDPTPVLKPSPSPEPEEGEEPSSVVPEDEDAIPDYLNEAANVISKAIEYESEERFDESVACYRKAIGTLLQNLPKDRCLKRQASVKRRVSQYISKAEALNEQIGGGDDQKVSTVKRGFPHLELYGDIRELKKYDVEDILGGKVLLVKNQDGKRVVLKTLLKSALVFRSSKTSLLPMNVRFMTKLRRYYETDEALYLVLEHISPGQLFKILQPYLIEQAAQFQGSNQPTSSTNVLTTLSESFVRSRSASLQPQVAEAGAGPAGGGDDSKSVSSSEQTGGGSVQDNESIGMDLEECSFTVVDTEKDANVNDEDEEEDGEVSDLLCLNQDGLERIQCTTQRDEDRFEMLEHQDQASLMDNLARLNKSLQPLRSSNLAPLNLTPQRLLNPAWSAPISAATTTTVSPTSFPPTPSLMSPTGNGENLWDIIPTYGGENLKSAKILPIGLLKTWAVQLIKSVFDLHSRNIFVQDLNPSNVLLNGDGQLVLTYQCEWVSVEKALDLRAVDQLYCAPEASTLKMGTPEADWWSVGVILFELLTGTPLCHVYPSGLRMHAPICWTNPHPEQDQDQHRQAHVLRDGEAEMRDLISKLLQPEPTLRLSTPSAIKGHKFFRGINWTH